MAEKVPLPELTYLDLYKIRLHLQRIRQVENLPRKAQDPEYAMLKRLEKGEITEYDFEFYMHEQIEACLVKQYGG